MTALSLAPGGAVIISAGGKEAGDQGRGIEKTIQEKAMAVLNQAKIPTYKTPERTIQAFVFMVTYNRNLEMLTQIPRKLSQTLLYDHDKVQHLLQDHMRKIPTFCPKPHPKKFCPLMADQ